MANSSHNKEEGASILPWAPAKTINWRHLAFLSAETTGKCSGRGCKGSEQSQRDALATKAAGDP